MGGVHVFRFKNTIKKVKNGFTCKEFKAEVKIKQQQIQTNDKMFPSHLPNNGIGEAALVHSLMYSQSANLVYRCSLERPWS